MEFTKEELGKLQSSMEFSRRKLQPFRRNQLAAVKQLVGKHYSDNGADDIVPVNYIELALNIYTQHLAARRPNVLITTGSKDLKPVAYKLALDINWLLDEIKIQKELHKAVMQAMFSIGIMKIGLHNTLSVRLGGRDYPLGEPFARSVSLDNWVHDMSSSNWNEIQFCGDRYSVPVDDLKDMGLNKEFISQLVPNDTSASIHEGDSEKTSSISKENEMAQDKFRETVDLWDIWVPHKNDIVTIAEQVDIVGKTIEWEGPPTGPYHFLKFNEVIDNIMPLSPVSTWQDLHTLANSLFRKLGRQANRQKKVTAVQGSADSDGNRIVKASDGDMIKVERPESIKDINTGGIDQMGLMFFLQVTELANTHFGNLNAMGGLDTSAETLGQDQLLTANASKRLESMQKNTIEFATAITKDIGWYRWTDPVRSFPVTIKEYGVEQKSSISILDRETDFYEYNFEIEAFSMQHQTPASRASALMRVYEGVLAPASQQLASQGIFINYENFLNTLSKYINLPELKDMLIYANPQEQQEGSHGESVRMNPNTTRKYIREGRPGPSRQGNNRVLQQLVAASGQQGNQ